MSEPCPRCGHYVTARAVGAARILMLIENVSADWIARSPMLAAHHVEEVREIAREMICPCEESTARVQAKR